MKTLKFTLVLILIGISSYAQNVIPKFGNVSMDEMNMKSYPKDTTANAVVLFEQGDVKFVTNHNEIYLQTEIYKKIM